MYNGEYVHFGVEFGLLAYQESPCGVEEIVLEVSTDGFQFAKSSRRVGWPIFGCVVGSGLNPFLIGLYVGMEKLKSVDVFLAQFCDELERLRVKGGISVRSGNGDPRLVLYYDFYVI